MSMPLFPLNVVLFPGMILPLHIFEPRYRAMIDRCLEEQKTFGVVLIEEGQPEGEIAVPHRVGTAARIMKTQREQDGRINVTTMGTQRFLIEELDHSEPYLQGIVRPLPIVNAATRSASEMMQHVRPKVLEYVDILAQVSRSKISLDRLPNDPKTLAFLVAIALQVDNDAKQSLLELPGVPEILAREHYLLAREILLLRHMLDTQPDLAEMSSGPTGSLFAN